MAEKAFDNGQHHLAAHLFINATINYHNAMCEKFLDFLPSHKSHEETEYFKQLQPILEKNLPTYRETYRKLIGYKSDADYGSSFSVNSAEKVRRKARQFREIVEPLLT